MRYTPHAQDEPDDGHEPPTFGRHPRSAAGDPDEEGRQVERPGAVGGGELEPFGIDPQCPDGMAEHGGGPVAAEPVEDHPALGAVGPDILAGEGGGDHQRRHPGTDDPPQPPPAPGGRATGGAPDEEPGEAEQTHPDDDGRRREQSTGTDPGALVAGHHGPRRNGRAFPARRRAPGRERPQPAGVGAEGGTGDVASESQEDRTGHSEQRRDTQATTPWAGHRVWGGLRIVARRVRIAPRILWHSFISPLPSGFLTAGGLTCAPR